MLDAAPTHVQITPLITVNSLRTCGHYVANAFPRSPLHICSNAQSYFVRANTDQDQLGAYELRTCNSPLSHLINTEHGVILAEYKLIAGVVCLL